MSWRETQLDRIEHNQVVMDRKLNAILVGLNIIFKQEQGMTQQLNDLEAQVTENTSVEQSALVLIQGLHDKLEAALEDPAKLTALKDELKASATALAAAVAANTPSEPAPVVDPTPAPEETTGDTTASE